MESTSTLARLRWRSLPLILVGLIAGAFLLSPAVGQAAAFLTKQRGDRRFLGNTVVVTAQAGPVATGDGESINVMCPGTRQATGGGLDSPHASTNSSAALIQESKAIQVGTRSRGWNVEIYNLSGPPTTFTAYAVCSP
jgi:hypothetical protein